MIITMRNVAFSLIALGIVFLAIAHSPFMHWSNQAKSSTGEGTGDCGVVALALICQADNNVHPLVEIRRLAHTTSQGTNLLNLKKAAESLGYTAFGARLGFDALHEHVSRPHGFAILHIAPTISSPYLGRQIRNM